METMVMPPRTGIEAFEIMPEGTRCQLINDVLVMSPAPDLPHADCQNEIFYTLYNFLKSNNLGRVYCAPVDVYINNKNVYQPDILFISNERRNIIQKKAIHGAPDLVIEILSNDRNYDLKKKKKAYEQSGVKEYWVVDPDTKWCEGFVLENEQFKSIGEGKGQIQLRILDLEITF